MPEKCSHRMRGITLAILTFGVLLGAAWAQTEHVLYSFCSQTNCADGANPAAGLIFDQNGDLYGTTASGGAKSSCPPVEDGCGVVFKLAPKGKETVLYTFCAQANCADGANPTAGRVAHSSPVLA
jgi:uncharacterized repeat protein (TIGR03803 family)